MLVLPEEVPVHMVHDLTPEQAKAHRVADNQTATIAEWDMDPLSLRNVAVRVPLRASGEPAVQEVEDVLDAQAIAVEIGAGVVGEPSGQKVEDVLDLERAVGVEVGAADEAATRMSTGEPMVTGTVSVAP
jgi:hypothetical protein